MRSLFHVHIEQEVWAHMWHFLMLCYDMYKKMDGNHHHQGFFFLNGCQWLYKHSKSHTVH